MEAGVCPHLLHAGKCLKAPNTHRLDLQAFLDSDKSAGGGVAFSCCCINKSLEHLYGIVTR